VSLAERYNVRPVGSSEGVLTGPGPICKNLFTTPMSSLEAAMINYTHPARTTSPASIDYHHPRRPRRDERGTVHLQKGQSVFIARIVNDN
jgi:hypothetical protein